MRTRRPTGRRLACAAGVVSLTLAHAASARAPLSHLAPYQSLTSRPYRPFNLDRAEFEAFLDDFIARRMEAEHIPGVAFYMVKDGKEFLAKGHGYADLEKRTPMDPRLTVLGAGSLTKLVTATACMQLVEQDKLDLFADVDDHLTAFHIPATFAEPITLANLLEHTDGLDVAHIGIAARTKDDVIPLETYLAQHLPTRVRPPGMNAVYGEHGMTLAGYLVQCAGGESYEQYVRDHLLRPLKMQRSDFRIRADMADNVSVAYVFVNGAYKSVTPEYAYHITPAAGLLTTAEDFGHFILAHLNDGRYGSAHILEPATARLMCMQKFGLHPMLSAWSYGFHSRYHGKEFCIEHGGTSLRSISQMLIMPERQLGFVIAGNSLSMHLQKEFLDAFLTRYFGPDVDMQNVPSLATDAVDARTFDGTYAAMHRSLSTIERLNSISHQTQVYATSPTTLHTVSAFDSLDWTRIAPTVYESTVDESRIAFVSDGNSNVLGMLNGPHECERLAWWEAVSFHRLLFAAMGVIFASGCGAPVLMIMIRRRAKAGRMSARDRVHAAVIAGLCLVNLLFIVGLAVVVHRTDPLAYLFGLPRMMALILWLPIIGLTLIAAAAGFVLSAWVDRKGSLLRRLHESLVIAAAFLFVVIAVHWNLLGFNVA